MSRWEETEMVSKKTSEPRVSKSQVRGLWAGAHTRRCGLVSSCGAANIEVSTDLTTVTTTLKLDTEIFIQGLLQQVVDPITEARLISNP